MKKNEKYPHLKRIGRFFVSEEMILQLPEVVRSIMGCFIILDADRYEAREQGQGSGIRYLAVSPWLPEHVGKVADCPYYSLKLVAPSADPRGPVLNVGGVARELVIEREEGARSIPS